MKNGNKYLSGKHITRYYPENEPILLNHGYDENKAISELNIDDMKQAAVFQGGHCLSEEMIKGDMTTPLEWECQFGHRFTASPALGFYWADIGVRTVSLHLKL
jgi:hypothetical protein